MRAFFYGTADAPYHPMDGIAERMKEIFPDMDITVSCREEELQELKKELYEVCFLYTDFLQPPMGRKAAAALLSFTAQGGGLFAIHGGIAVQNRPELGQLLGGLFAGHPPYEGLPVVPYKVADREHPVMKGVSDFSIPDEFYLFEFPRLDDRHVILSYENQGKIYPAGWIREYGLGRVIYLCCGHNADAFADEMLCRLLKNGTDWLMEKRGENNA